MENCSEPMTEYSPMQQVKRRFYAMRNGIVADTLRRSGHPCRMIFGLNLPQIIDIAAETGPSAELAEELWADRRTRESLLLAPMLYPASAITPETARAWMRAVPAAEVADILCHRLLRRLPSAWDLASELATDPEPMTRYTALRLMRNILTRENAHLVRPVAEAELDRAEPLTRPLCLNILDEITFLLEEDETTA